MSAKKNNKKGNSNNQSNKNANNQNKKQDNNVNKTNSSKSNDNLETKFQVNEKKADVKTSKKEKTKEEEIVFKNSKSEAKQTEGKKDDKNKTEENKNDKKGLSNEKNKPEKDVKEITELTKIKSEKSENSKKKLIIVVVITVFLLLLLVFSTCFALVHVTKDTIARGVSIKNVDVSNLTYNEAKEKLEEAFDIALGININLKYEDFSYVVASSDINLSYELTEALEEAYSIGRSDGIFKNNFDLIYAAIFSENIEIEYEYDEDALDTITQYVSANVPNLVKQYSYYIEESELIITPGSDGIKVDEDELKNQILKNINNRDLNNISTETVDEEIDIPYEEVVADDIDIEAIYNDIKQEPQDAYYVEATDTTDFAIYTDVDGIDFAISLEEAEEIISIEGAEEYRIPLTITEAEVTINDIGIEAFTYKVSTYSTTYDASNTSRSENLRIAASKINGTVIMPGEQFSFNEVVGERTVSEGYQNAAVYSDGQVVDGLAGGICQISSTLYNAVLLANLQIDERYNHSFTTSYVEAGRDATVVYGTKDLKFTNTRNYPIKIEAIVSDGVATFSIYGIEEETEYTVKIIPVKTETTPYTTQTIVDSSLATGTTVVSQAGASGCKVTTYKEVYLNNVMISREEISNDTYQVMTRIIRVGA